MIGHEISVRYDPGLIEEAVFIALMGDKQALRFHRERSRLYEIPEAERRERAFQNFHLAWFVRLGLGRQIVEALSEHPLVTAAVSRFFVALAPAKRDEGAELFVGPDEGLGANDRRTVRILLRPELLLDAAPLLVFLRHELLHITDMLDPRFGYEPKLPAAEGGATHDLLIKERYRILWDATIDGRMVRRGWAAESIRAERLSDFRRAFPMFGEETEQLFSRFFDREPHTHAELVAFAGDPRGAVGRHTTSHAGSRCPLCRFSTYDFEPEPKLLPAEVIGEITQDFPHWRPSQGLCLQCADLYRAHAISIRTATSLPGGQMRHRADPS